MPQPIITVSAVLLFDTAGRLLTVRKRGTDRFMLPGGKPEPGESALDAAVREAHEEIGLRLDPAALTELGVFETAAANEPGHLVRATVFRHGPAAGHSATARPADADLLSRISPAAEIAELRWLDLDAPLPGDLAPLLSEAILPALTHPDGRRPHPLRAVAVFTGARDGVDPAHARLARALGAELAGAGVALVYGGGKVGLMGAVADGALEAGGDVVGVMPQDLVDREIGHAGLTELHVVDSMHERKARMTELADGFLALPGGAGTLDELFEAWTWQQLGLHAKPIGLVGRDYWAPLLAMLDHMAAAGFVRTEDRDALVVADSPAEALAGLRAWTPPAPKWR